MTDRYTLEIYISSQSMKVFDATGSELSNYAVSTASNGPGQVMDSGCTPMGKHVVRAKIGEGEPVNTVFRGRRPSGEIYQKGMRDQYPGRDWILTRILWLSGVEPGFNRLGSVDTMRRYIYIHGTPDEIELGQPGSHGCVRMRNRDLLELFDMIPVGTPVNIHG